jgi:hypothetical protein
MRPDATHVRPDAMDIRPGEGDARPDETEPRARGTAIPFAEGAETRRAQFPQLSTRTGDEQEAGIRRTAASRGPTALFPVALLTSCFPVP